MKLQRRFAPISGEFTPESVARFIGIRILIILMYGFLCRGLIHNV